MRVLDHPLFCCGFRPFFLLGALYGVFLMGVWLFSWPGIIAMPDTVGGPIVWHAYELLYGVTFAAIAGFLLTATPEFVSAREVNRGRLLALVLLWITGRAAFWMSGTIGVLPTAMLNLALPIALLALLAPPILRDVSGHHRSFVVVLVALTLAEVGFYTSAYRGHAMLPWLYSAIGAIMVLIIVALSRISMRIINGLEEGIELFDTEVEYIARPPRRNLAMLTITLYTLLELLIPGNPVTGWVALAAAAAMLNLLNDWHIGRPLFNRWVFSLYSIYWAMALGYLLAGLAILSGWPLLSPARHVLTIGAIGFSVFIVMVFASQVHSGRAPEYRSWVLWASVSLLMAVVCRIAMSLPAFAALYQVLLSVSAILWMTAFSMFVGFFWKTLVRPSADGRHGCLADDTQDQSS